MENMKNVSKMRLAALQAWKTRRLNAAMKEKGNVKEKKKIKKEVKKTIGRTVKDILKQERVKDVSGEAGGCLKGDEQKAMKALNGVDLEKLAKETQKRLDRKAKMSEAKDGKEARSMILGGIIKKAKIERFNGGIKVSGVVQ